MLTLCVFVGLIFRWALLSPVLGAKKMYLFDAVLFTIFAALGIASPGEWPWLAYLMTIFCAWTVYHSVQSFIHYDEMMRKIENGDEDDLDS